MKQSKKTQIAKGVLVMLAFSAVCISKVSVCAAKTLDSSNDDEVLDDDTISQIRGKYQRAQFVCDEYTLASSLPVHDTSEIKAKGKLRRLVVWDILNELKQSTVKVLCEKIPGGSYARNFFLSLSLKPQGTAVLPEDNGKVSVPVRLQNYLLVSGFSSWHTGSENVMYKWVSFVDRIPSQDIMPPVVFGSDPNYTSMSLECMLDADTKPGYESDFRGL
jgi:hypothetical protein